MKRALNLLFGLTSLMATNFAVADEGMWQPHQLQQLSSVLKEKGLTLDPQNMTDLGQFPMNAIISLGGCTASFVSPNGLALTNHHCAHGSIQYNSTEQNNLLEQGFVAKNLKDELKAAPGSRIYVTESVVDVTDKVSATVSTELEGEAYHQAIVDNEKQLVAECEANQNYRCEVFSFHGGAEYYLIKLLAIRDVRLVYAPPSSIGKFGGDTDNWMWPRHTGDWAFYRAYVAPDGSPADYSDKNVPYQPKAHLKVNASGVKQDDFVMVLGYPGRTNRYRTELEVENQFTWVYPTAKRYREEYMEVIKSVAAKGSDARIKYESTLAGLANYAKNYGSMVESFEKGDMLSRKRELHQQLAAWIEASEQRKEQYGDVLPNLNRLIQQGHQNQERDLLLAYMGRTNLWKAAQRLYRLAHERAKPDALREPGYQQRDMGRFAESMKKLNRRYDAEVDKAVLKHFMQQYVALPASQQVAELNGYFNLGTEFNHARLAQQLDAMHDRTRLDEEAERLAWMDRSVEQFQASDDPYIRFAVAMFDYEMRTDAKDKDLSGELKKARPAYMEALIAYKKSLNQPVYADANSSLRITYGSVTGYSPKDGMMATPFTTLEGMLAKHVPDDEEFDLPSRLVDAIQTKDYDRYVQPELGSVPVNFLSTVDTTGGNSGSPTLNGKGELVGLLFDGVYESIIGDWDYDKKLNRSIHTTTPYMLWVMEKIDGAESLIEEMTLVE